MVCLHPIGPVPKNKKVKRNKPRREQDKQHLAYVASLPCACCQTTPVQVHHLLRCDPQRGMGRKASDRHTIPLCSFCHGELHAYGDEVWFLEKYGVDGPSLAQSLWELSHE